MSKKSMLISYDWLPLFKAMEEHDVCEILFALMEYDQTGKKPALKFKDRLLNSIYQNMLAYVEENHLLYAERCEKNSQNAKKRTQANANERKQSQAMAADKIRVDKNRADKIREDVSVIREDASSHTPPSREEVKEFCKAEGLNAIDPDRFWNYYTGVKDWRNDRGDLIDWKAQARYWNSQDAEAKKAANTEFNNFSQRNTDWKSLEKELLAK